MIKFNLIIQVVNQSNYFGGINLASPNVESDHYLICTQYSTKCNIRNSICLKYKINVCKDGTFRMYIFF